MLWLKFISKLIKAVNANAAPSELALAAVLSMFVSLSPGFLLQDICAVFLILLLRVNITFALVMLPVFKLLAFSLDPIAEKLGSALLSNSSLKDFWTALYNMPLIPFSRFNNTVVLGMLVISFILAVPVYLLVKQLIIKYRSAFLEKVNKFKITKVLKASKFFQIYLKVR